MKERLSDVFSALESLDLENFSVKQFSLEQIFIKLSKNN